MADIRLKRHYGGFGGPLKGFASSAETKQRINTAYSLHLKFVVETKTKFFILYRLNPQPKNEEHEHFLVFIYFDNLYSILLLLLYSVKFCLYIC